MIILRPGTNDCAFIIVVILIANVPIQTSIDLECQPGLRRLVTVGIRSNKKSWRADRVSDTATLAIVFIDAIRGKESEPTSKQRGRINEEEIVSHIIKTVALRMVNSVEEVVDDSIAVNPVVVIAGIQLEPGIGCPVHR